MPENNNTSESFAIIKEYRDRLKKVTEQLVAASSEHAYFYNDFIAGLQEKAGFRGCPNWNDIFQYRDIQGEGFNSVVYDESAASRCTKNWAPKIRDWAAIVVPRTNNAAAKAAQLTKEKRLIEQEIESILKSLASTPEAQQAVEQIKNDVQNTLQNEAKEAEAKTKRKTILIVSGSVIALIFVIVYAVIKLKKKQK